MILPRIHSAHKHPLKMQLGLMGGWRGGGTGKQPKVPGERGSCCLVQSAFSGPFDVVPGWSSAVVEICLRACVGIKRMRATSRWLEGTGLGKRKPLVRRGREGREERGREALVRWSYWVKVCRHGNTRANGTTRPRNQERRFQFYSWISDKGVLSLSEE